MPMYTVRCECGAGHAVAGTAAGTRLDCACGRTVEVPSLSKLRASAGEPTVSAELAIKKMVERDEMPAGTDCLECRLPTRDTATILVVCEQAEFKREQTGISVVNLLFGIFTGFFVFNRPVSGELVGRDVSFRLPLRLYRDCLARLGKADARRIVAEVPLYRQLLDKYPHADVSALMAGRTRD